ncbi:MAG: DUF2726 domain-containing protein [Proteobacteria bacterium]|nr:DUF2726 domain-containing protein [Pseudomonadota bacterium]
MQYLVIDGQSVAVLLTAAITFTIGALAGFQIARLRLSDVEFCKMQLRTVFRAPFQKQKLMNFSEFQVFRIIEQDSAIRRAGFRLVAQAPLGEFLKSQHKKGFRAVNGKRVDMLLLDRSGWPVLAIEYQGEGHYDDTSDLRDIIKRTALTKAGIGYLELFPKDKNDTARIRTLVHERLGLNMPVRDTASSNLPSNIRVLHS